MNNNLDSRLKRLEQKSKQKETGILIFEAVDKNIPNFAEGYKCTKKETGTDYDFFCNGKLMNVEELEGKHIFIDDIQN
jgi:hypothetical protein